MAFLATGPLVIDQEHDERVWVMLDVQRRRAVFRHVWLPVGASRGHQAQGFHRTVAAAGRRKFPFALAFTSERDDIHHLSGTVESWELPGDGPFLFPIDAQARLGLIKDMAKSRIFIEKKPGVYLRMYKDAKTGLMLITIFDKIITVLTRYRPIVLELI